LARIAKEFGLGAVGGIDGGEAGVAFEIFAENNISLRRPREPACGGFHFRSDICGVATDCGDCEDVAADAGLVAHEAADEGDALAVRGPSGIGDLQRRLVNGFHQASGGVEREELGDIPVVVAIAESGGNGKVEAVGGPVVFVDISVGGRNLAELVGGYVNEGQALLKEGVFDLASFGSFGDKRARGARCVFGKEQGDGFAIWRPPRSGEEAFDLCEFSSRACRGRGVHHIELKLACFCGVRKESELFAIGGPGDAAFRVDGAGDACADALGESFDPNIRDENYRVAGGDPTFCDDVLDPGNFLAVGGNGSLFEPMRGGKRLDDVLGCAGRFGLRAGRETRFGGFLGAAGFFRGTLLSERSVRAAKY